MNEERQDKEGKFDYSLMPVLPLHIDNNQSLKYYY